MKLYLIGKGKEYPVKKKQYSGLKKPIIFHKKKINKAYFFDVFFTRYLERNSPKLFFMSNEFKLVSRFCSCAMTGSPESQQPTGSQFFIRICMEIYLKIDKMVKMYKNSY